MAVPFKGSISSATNLWFMSHWFVAIRLKGIVREQSSEPFAVVRRKEDQEMPMGSAIVLGFGNPHPEHGERIAFLLWPVYAPKTLLRYACAPSG